MADLNVKINNLEMKNPVMTASGTFGYGIEFADLVQLDEIGGIIVKGTTLHAREGNMIILVWRKLLAECLIVLDCKIRA